MALTNKLTAIADAIRSRTGKTDAMTLEQMASEISGMKMKVPNGWRFSYCDVACKDFIESLDMSAVTDYSYLFRYCGTWTEIDFTKWGTLNKPTSLAYLCSNCGLLEQINLSNVDTSNTTDMQQMLNSCYKLKALDISHFDVSKTTSINNFCRYCQEMTTLTVGTFDMASCTNADGAFDNCNALTTINGTFTNIGCNIRFGQSPLTRASALVIINGLKQGAGKTVVFSTTTKNLLTTADKALITNKGWTLA